MADSDKLLLPVLVAVSAFLGYVGYRFDFEFSLFPMFLLMVIYVAWKGTLKTTMLFSAVADTVIIFKGFTVERFYSNEFFRYWDTLQKAVILVVVGYVFWKIRDLMQSLRMTNRQLVDALSEIKRLHLDLSQRAVELEAANQDLEAFNYTVAHDLRQPLNLLSGYCQLISKLCGEHFNDECRSYVHDTYQVTLRMNRIIESLLNFARMGRAELRREMVDLATLAHEVAEALKQSDPGRRVEFRIADGIMASCDANLLRVVLDNLLGNAWKYTAMRGDAIIEFGASDHGEVYFVQDNGAGFDMSDAVKLFTPFCRLPGAEKSKGFGIGLATVSRIISRHGGKVWAEGEPGKGATFYFTLPSDNVFT